MFQHHLQANIGHVRDQRLCQEPVEDYFRLGFCCQYEKKKSYQEVWSSKKKAISTKPLDNQKTMAISAEKVEKRMTCSETCKHVI